MVASSPGSEKGIHHSNSAYSVATKNWARWHQEVQPGQAACQDNKNNSGITVRCSVLFKCMALSSLHVLTLGSKLRQVAVPECKRWPIGTRMNCFRSSFASFRLPNRHFFNAGQWHPPNRRATGFLPTRPLGLRREPESPAPLVSVSPRESEWSRVQESLVSQPRDEG